MRKTDLFLIALLTLPVLLGATTSEEARRIEEEKRQKLRPSEAVLHRRRISTPKEKPSIDRSIYNRLLKQQMVTVGEGREMVQILADESFTVSRPEDEPLSRGLLGRMICQALDIKGGLTMRIFGPTERYAHKELVYRGIMFPGSSREYISGKELIVSIIRAIEYMAEDSL